MSVFILLLTLFTPSISTYNVLFIVADDFRPDLGGLYGQNQVYTPNLEALMDEAVTFTHTYCQLSLCAPSRTSFLTSLRPDTSRVWQNQEYFRTTMPNNTGLDVITLPQYFKQNNYYTVGAGKFFHPGYSSGGPSKTEGGADEPYSWTEDYWFCDQFYNGTFQSLGHFDYSCTAMQNWPNGTGCVQDSDCISCLESFDCYTATTKNTTCVADCDDSCFPDGAVAIQIDKYLSEISQSSNKQPFFVAAGLKRPHMTWYVPTRYREMYPLDTITPSTYNSPPIDMPIPAFNNNTEMQSMMDVKPYLFKNQNDLLLINKTYHTYLIAGYYSSISFMDSQLGNILASLRKYDFYDNTIVVFLGDHGYHLGEQGAWSKFTNFELGVRVPFIFRIPGINEGQSVDAIVESVDVFPTIVDAAGLDLSPLSKQLAGKSLKSLIYNTSSIPDFSEIAYSQFRRVTEANGVLMGVGFRNKIWRYNEWCAFDFDKAYPIFNECYGTELYNHNSSFNENDYNSFENKNLAYETQYSDVVENLHQILVNTWV